jgi:cell division protease FtsH
MRAMPGPAKRPTPNSKNAPSPRSLFLYVALAVGLLWIWQETFQRLAYEPIAYSAFKQALAAGEVKRAAVADQHIEGELLRAREGGGQESVLFRTARVEDPKLTDELLAARVEVVGVHPSLLSQLLWAWLLPLALIFGLWIILSRRFAAAGAQALSFGRSRARLVADAETGVDFSDVEGCREAKDELVEVVDYLKGPERYRALGAKIPKGVLLLGPPGTGKTLLARAVAGEAGVPFYSISGSDFVEMFVGVGAARVRDLFAQAKSQAPCIVFIDEIDAIGRQRGVQMGMVNDEREQTLNQLLVELDGFDANSGVIVLAATNRPEVLDRALLRPGRFDRQVLVDAPDREGREAILRLHVANKPLAGGVDLTRVARATPGFSGADLANVANEAALTAARERSAEITQRHLDAAVEKVVAGPERRSRRLNEEDRRRVAFHEVGHALVAARSAGADPVHKISIVPRGRGALGYTLQLPEEDRLLLSRSALASRIRTLLGGRELLRHENLDAASANCCASRSRPEAAVRLRTGSRTLALDAAPREAVERDVRSVLGRHAPPGSLRASCSTSRAPRPSGALTARPGTRRGREGSRTGRAAGSARPSRSAASAQPPARTGGLRCTGRGVTMPGARADRIG